MSLTSNISAKTWSKCTCRGCFENVLQIDQDLWDGSNRAKQITTDLWSPLYILPKTPKTLTLDTITVSSKGPGATQQWSKMGIFQKVKNTSRNNQPIWRMIGGNQYIFYGGKVTIFQSR